MSVEQMTNHATIICYHQINNNNCTYMHIGVRDVNEDINFILKFLHVKKKRCVIASRLLPRNPDYRTGLQSKT